MNDFEEFSIDLYHAKLKWMSFQSGYIQPLWSDSIQNQISSFSNLAVGNFEIEPHIIACQSYFGEKNQLKEILQQIPICLKEQKENGNKDSFSMCLFNRMNLIVIQQ